MGMFTLLRFENMDDLLLLQLQDLYDAETRLRDALPMMANAAQSPELADVLRQHQKQTEGHLKQLEKIFGRLGERPEPQMSSAMRGLISDGEEILNARGDQAMRDAALISAAQRNEHYEITGYTNACAYAQRLGKKDVAQALGRILNDEVQTDKDLSRLAKRAIEA